MTLKRYTKEELIPLVEEMAYEYLAEDTKTYFLNKSEKESTSVPRILYNNRVEIIKEIEDRVVDYTQKRDLVDSPEDKDVFTECNEIISNEGNNIKRSNLKTQKDLYKKEKNIFNSRTYFEFPLNKKINALYDDFNLLVLMYDDVSTVSTGGKLEQFEALTTKEERIKFLKENTEFTHISLASSTRVPAAISICGLLDETYSKEDSSNQEILTSKYCDFNAVTLADTMRIKNNDLKQLIQSKLDIDKENLKVVDEKMVRGDLYKILELPKEVKEGKEQEPVYYIRYVCPSTGRVYFNEITERHLSNSEYFKKGDVSSYIWSWFSINNLGMKITEDMTDLIRC